MSKVLNDVLDEQQRQIEKHGKHTHHPFVWHSILSEEVGEVAKDINDLIFTGNLSKLAALREELVQVAAVACSFIEDIDNENYTQNHLNHE